MLVSLCHGHSQWDDDVWQWLINNRDTFPQLDNGAFGDCTMAVGILMEAGCSTIMSHDIGGEIGGYDIWTNQSIPDLIKRLDELMIEYNNHD